jgi:hypothetical protein
VISIDPRPAGRTRDVRPGGWAYEQNTTEHMLDLLRELPDVDMDKLETFDAGTDTLHISDLPIKPDYCFIDGEHTRDAVLRDAWFCADALGGRGVIAFHDSYLIGSAISAFIRPNRREISFALAFNTGATPAGGGGVFALELGDRGLLNHPAIGRALGSRWHDVAWKAANRPSRTALPLLVMCATILRSTASSRSPSSASRSTWAHAQALLVGRGVSERQLQSWLSAKLAGGRLRAGT